jgi:hypothetical protein
MKGQRLFRRGVLREPVLHDYTFEIASWQALLYGHSADETNRPLYQPSFSTNLAPLFKLHLDREKFPQYQNLVANDEP